MRNIVLLLLIAALFMRCTSDVKEDLLKSNVKISFTNFYSNHSFQSTETDFADEQINSLAIYICEEGVVRKIYNPTTDFTTINLSPDDATSSSKIYAVANFELCPELSNLQVGSHEQLLLEMRTTGGDEKGHMEAIAMTGFSTINNGELKIDLKRNMARFDLKVKPDAGIEVHSVSVSGLATESSLFETTPEQTSLITSTTIHQVFTQALVQSTERLFYTNPLPSTATAAVATIEASYNGAKVGMQVPLREIRRNHIYTLNVSSSGGILTTTVAVSDMEVGDEVEPDKKNAIIRIDNAKTTLSDGVLMNGTYDRLTFPNKGGAVTLYLTGDSHKELKEIGDHAISGFELITNREEQSYNIKVGRQTKQGNNYPAVILSFGAIGETNPAKWDRIVVVATNDAPFSVVTIGKLQWMVTNGWGREVNEYPLLKEGVTLRNLFTFPRDWAKYSGKLYQWGPRTGSFAKGGWEGIWDYNHNTLANCNGPILENAKSWEGEKVPCPDGWRLPTYEEYQTIWATEGTVIPENGTSTTYITSTGVTYSAVIEQFGGSYNTLPVQYGAPAKNLIITDGTQELLFPITGCRNANGVYGNQWFDGYAYNMGTEAYYWCRDVIDNKYIAVGIKSGAISNNKTNKGAANWMNVRCVHDVE